MKESVNDGFVLTQERWYEIMFYLQAELFWKPEYHAVEIENIIEALRNHKIENNVENFQLKRHDNG